MNKKKCFVINQDIDKGLSQVIDAVKEHTSEMRYELIPINKIELDPGNPRDLVLNFEDINNNLSKDDPLFNRKQTEIESLQSLAESIKSQGLINPVVVYKAGEKYTVVAGERRCLASKIIGQKLVRANILDDKPSEYKKKLIQWVENIEREDLSLWERFVNLKAVIEAYQKEKKINKISIGEISTIVGCSIRYARNYHSMLMASDDVVDAIKMNKVSNIEKVAMIMQSPSEQIRLEALNACINGETLTKIKEIVNCEKEKRITNIRKKDTNESRGRKSEKVNLGQTKNKKAVKYIMECILNTNRFESYKQKFNSVNWGDYNNLTEAFNQLLQIIEIEEN